jgi:hypothetical protein
MECVFVALLIILRTLDAALVQPTADTTRPKAPAHATLTSPSTTDSAYRSLTVLSTHSGTRLSNAANVTYQGSMSSMVSVKSAFRFLLGMVQLVPAILDIFQITHCVSCPV